MLRPRKEPDPLHGKRKLLDEQERLLAERMSQLNDQLARGCQEEGVTPKINEPPVWRLEDDAPPAPNRTEQPTVNKRVLARQRQRDMIFFFVMMGALLVVVLLVWALAHSHAPGTQSGS